MAIIQKNTNKIFQLCDKCINRIENKISEKEIKDKIIRSRPDKCWLCEGIYNDISKYQNFIEKTIKEYEFDSFLLGTKIDEDILEKEKIFSEYFDIKEMDSIKYILNHDLGLKLEKKTGINVNFNDPTIMIILDTCFDHISLQIKSLYIYGRYKKLKRNIPQTRWDCRICRGIGCKKCDYTGKTYQSSIEEIISKIFLKETKAPDESFHGAGREDIDVLMLGNGRPFIIELKNPKKRKVDLKKIEKNVNERYSNIIKISNLKYSNKKEVIRIKNSSFRKKYRVKFSCKGPINIEKLKKVCQSLGDTVIKQKTPTRVAHRRADMIREKHIYSCEIHRLEDTIIILDLETESGTYIKELISGDDNRTMPNISSLIGAPCQVESLDVLEIKGE